MMWIIAVITVFLWLLGFMSSHMMGGFIHILLVVACIAMLIGISTDRRSTGQTEIKPKNNHGKIIGQSELRNSDGKPH